MTGSDQELMRQELWRLSLLRDPLMEAFSYLRRVIECGEGMTAETAQVLDNAEKRICEAFG